MESEEAEPCNELFVFDSDEELFLRAVAIAAAAGVSLPEQQHETEGSRRNEQWGEYKDGGSEATENQAAGEGEGGEGEGGEGGNLDPGPMDILDSDEEVIVAALEMPAPEAGVGRQSKRPFSAVAASPSSSNAPVPTANLGLTPESPAASSGKTAARTNGHQSFAPQSETLPQSSSSSMASGPVPSAGAAAAGTAIATAAIAAAATAAATAATPPTHFANASTEVVEIEDGQRSRRPKRGTKSRQLSRKSAGSASSESVVVVSMADDSNRSDANNSNTSETNGNNSNTSNNKNTSANTDSANIANSTSNDDATNGSIGHHTADNDRTESSYGFVESTLATLPEEASSPTPGEIVDPEILDLDEEIGGSSGSRALLRRGSQEASLKVVEWKSLRDETVDFVNKKKMKIETEAPTAPVLLELLEDLSDCVMDDYLLKNTGIGKTVTGLRKHANPDVASKASVIVSQWKRDRQTRMQVCDILAKRGNLELSEAKRLEDSVFHCACPDGLEVGDDKKDYQRDYLRICNHLKERGPGCLSEKLRTGEINIDEVAFLPDEALLSDAKREKLELVRKEALKEALLTTGAQPDGTPSENFTCPGCNSNRCLYKDIQTGWHNDQQDMTILVQCLDCKYRWKADDDHGGGA